MPDQEPSTPSIPPAEEFKARLLGLNGAPPPEKDAEIPPEFQAGEERPAQNAASLDPYLAEEITQSAQVRAELAEQIRSVIEVDRVVNGGSRPRGWLKRFIVTICRPFTRRQAVYNALLLNALAESSDRHARIHSKLHQFSANIAKDQTAMLEKLDHIHANGERLEAVLRELKGGIHSQGDMLGEMAQNLEVQRRELTAALFEEMSRQLREGVTPEMIRSIAESKELLRDSLKSLVAEEAGALRAIVKAAKEAAGEKQGGANPGGVPQEFAAFAAGADIQKLREALSYFHFEHFNRGTPDQIKERQSRYIDLFTEKFGGTLEGRQFLDLGGGSGLFAGALQEAGAEAEAVDSNMAAVGAGQEAGRPVSEADIFKNLAAREDASLDVITSFQVVEHLPGHLLAELCQQAMRVLKPGGYLLAETLNPRSFAAFRWYLMDLSHVHFLQPETLEHIAREEGFDEIEVEEITLPPDYERLTIPEDTEPEMRKNLEILNKTLYGPQEYYLIAQKRAE